MKYTTEVTIKLRRQKVIDLFDDEKNLYKWQEGLKSVEHLSGTPGQPGAKTKLVFDMNGRIVEMTETILSNNLPDTMALTFDAKGVHNIIENRFTEVDAGTTKWAMDSDFQFSGFMKIMGWLMSGMFKKQTKKTMDRFKEFAENTEK